jgi:hypothetical protein
MHLPFEVYHLDALLFPALLFSRMHLPFECIVVSNLQQKIKCWTFLLRIACFYCCRAGTSMLASKIQALEDQMSKVWQSRVY